MWLTLVSVFSAVAVPAVGALIAGHLKHVAQLHRAQLLSHIADEAAAVVVANNPRSSWANLLVLVTQQLSAAAGLNVTDAKALERAAGAALARAGVKPAS